MDKWNEISYNLSEKKDISEDKFELIVIQALGILGWKKYFGGLRIQPVFKTFANKRLKLDILAIHNNERVFIVEVKKPSLPINSDFKNQLKSYMRFLKIDFGLLIGEKIQIYYDGNKFGNNGFTIIEEVEYNNNNPKGLEFVQLFEKKDFDENRLINYAQKKFIKINNQIKEKKLRKELLNLNHDNLIKEALKHSLLSRYEETVIDNVFETIEIQVNSAGNLYSFNKKNPKLSNKKVEKTSIKKIKKKVAIEILKKKFIEVNSQNVIYSNMVEPHENWWLDPNPKIFEKDFYIVLNDYKERKLFVFEIPGRFFQPIEDHFYIRKDNYRVSIGILGNDKKNFKDTKFGKNPVHFIKYLKHNIEY